MGLSRLIDFNFYILMGIVILILYLHYRNSSKKEKSILRILISLYLVLTFGIFVLNFKI